MGARPFNTTGGCFNLLLLQHLEQRQKIKDQLSVETESLSSQDQTFNKAVESNIASPIYCEPGLNSALRKAATPTPKLSRIENIPSKDVRIQRKVGLKFQHSELQEQDENVSNPTKFQPSKSSKFGTIGDGRKKTQQLR